MKKEVAIVKKEIRKKEVAIVKKEIRKHVNVAELFHIHADRVYKSDIICCFVYRHATVHVTISLDTGLIKSRVISKTSNIIDTRPLVKQVRESYEKVIYKIHKK